jgi:hypothetical protein
MALTPMGHQSIVGIYAGPSQAIRFFKRQMRIVSRRSTISPRSIRVEPDCALVGNEQLVAHFAIHLEFDAPALEMGLFNSCGP